LKEREPFRLDGITAVKTMASFPTSRFNIVPGEVWMLWRGQTDVDVFAYTTSLQKVWIAISQLPYVQGSMRLRHLFTQERLPGISVCNFFRWCIDERYDPHTQCGKLGSNEHYMYITSNDYATKCADKVLLVPLKCFSKFFRKPVADFLQEAFAPLQIDHMNVKLE